MSLTLEKNIRAKSQYKGKTKFAFFNSIIPGDSINVSLQVTNPGGFGGRRYATNVYLRKENSVTGKEDTFSCSVTECAKYLNNLEYYEL